MLNILFASNMFFRVIKNQSNQKPEKSKTRKIKNQKIEKIITHLY
jgi:hypothetical protein